MRILLKRTLARIHWKRGAAGLLAVGALGVASAWAQPANDNFADAQPLVGIYGSTNGTNLGATAEVGEPSHAGFPANSSIWYQWTAPQDGEVTVDTYGSLTLLGQSMDTVLAVYTGASVSTLSQVAANNDLYPNIQLNSDLQNQFYYDTNHTAGQNLDGGIFQAIQSAYFQPYTGPSGLRFNAKTGVTYYFAVDTLNGQGNVALNWAYYSSGIFRFATEELDQTGITNADGSAMLLYHCADTESQFPSGGVDAATMVHSYYYYNGGVAGMMVTITRVAGAAGRVMVDYTTADGTNFPAMMIGLTNTLTTGFGPNAVSVTNYLLNGDVPAQAGVDYTATSGELVFNDYEMSKTILIPVNPSLRPAPNLAFFVLVTNVVLDPAESLVVSPPRQDTNYSTALVRILNTRISPEGVTLGSQASTNTVTGTTNTVVSTNAVFSLQATNALFNFQKAHYRVGRDYTNWWGNTLATIYVNRTGTNNAAATVNYRVNNSFFYGAKITTADNDNNEYPLQPESDYATPTPPGAGNILGTTPDFNFPGGTTGTLTWAANDNQPKPIHFNIIDNGSNQFNEDFEVELYTLDSNGNAHQPGMVAKTTVTILYDDRVPPAGSVDQRHNADYNLNMALPLNEVPNTSPANLVHPGTDGQVNALVVQPDDKTIVAGSFGSYDGATANGIARLNLDGSLDGTFNPGDGIFSAGGDYIAALVLQPDGKVVVGGDFPAFNGILQNSVVRLNSDGSIDSSFNVGTGVSGSVQALLLQSDGKVIIGGEFTAVNGIPRTRLARLNTDGSLDTTFDPGQNAPGGSVNALALTPSGQIVIGGSFTNLGAQVVNRLAQLNTDGTIDPTFSSGSGTAGPVYALATQPDGNILVGGEFSSYNTIYPISRLLRVNATGGVDTNFFTGVGPDGTVFNLTLQANGTFYVGGVFTAINGTRRAGFARLYPDGTVDTTFMDTAYNHFAGLPRGYFGEAPGAVYASGFQSDGNVLIGGNFSRVGGGQYDPNAWTAAFFEFGGTVDTNSLIEPKTRAGVRSRNNFARLIGGATPGPGNISLLNGSYSANESQSSIFVNLLRSNGLLGPASANFSVLPALAQGGVDYFYYAPAPIYWIDWEYLGTSRMHSDGLFGTNTFLHDAFGGVYWGGFYTLQSGVTVSVVRNTTVRGNLNAQFQLSNPGADQFYLGGEDIPLGTALGRNLAPFTLIDDNKTWGTFGFASPNYTGSGNTPIAVTRTNGTYGNVQVSYATSDGTAVANVDYRPASGTLTFINGQTNGSFNVQILNNSYISSIEKVVNLRLYGLNFTNGGPSLGLTNAVLRIINPNYQGYLNLSSTNYSTNLSAGTMSLVVTRTVGSQGTLTVKLATSNGTAANGTDYQGTTNTLQWNNGDVTPRTINIPLFNNGSVGGSKTFFAKLSNPTLNGNAAASLLGAFTNATCTISNDNSYGTFQFSSAAYNVNENGGYATITVTRTGAAYQSVVVNYSTADGSAVSSGPQPNYVATSGTLTFAAGDLAKSFTVPLLDDGVIDPQPFYFNVNLTGSTPSGVIGFQSSATVNIVDAEAFNQNPGSPDVALDANAGMNNDVLALAVQPLDGGIVAGGSFTTANSVPRNRIARLNSDGSLDGGFMNGLTGANGGVNALLLQTDSRIVIGGAFTTVNSVHRNFIARLNTDGSLDTSFNPGGGADGAVDAVAETLLNGSRRIYLAGGFGNYNGTARPKVARLNDNGSLDGAFAITSIDGTVFSVVPYPTNSVNAGKLLIGGDFLNISGSSRTRIARLNADGSLDTTFNPGTGAGSTVRAIALQNDGRILIGGSFTNVNGTVLKHIARLSTDGSLDASFTSTVGAGANDTVDTIILQPDNRILLGGLFTQANGVTRSRITRLMPTGGVDPTINFGSGANSYIAALALQPDGNILLGGGFTTYDDQPHSHFARIYGNAMTGSGGFEFSSGNYAVDEIGTNAVITVRRTGGTAGPNPDLSGDIFVHVSTSDGTAAAPVNYTTVTTSLDFPEGEVIRTFTVPVFDDGVVTPDLTVNLTLSSPTPPAIITNQPTAVLTIRNDDSTLSFSSPTYSVNKNDPFGVATIDILRQGSTNLACSVTFLTTTNGTAVIGTDYLAVSNVVTFNPGVWFVPVNIPVISNNVPSGNRTVTMLLTNAVGAVSNSVNLLIVPPAQATLTIIDTVQAPGQLFFAATNYVVAQNGVNAYLTVLRTNGSSGTVSVNYNTVAGSATPGMNYSSTSGTLTFGDGETTKTLAVPLINTSAYLPPAVFSVVLSNPTGGASLTNPTNSTVTIMNSNVALAFTSPAYVFNETNGFGTLSVVRFNGTNLTTTVQYYTTNGTALAGTNYFAASGTLTFPPGSTNQTVSVNLIHDPLATGNLSFGLSLSNASGGAQLAFPSTASVILLDAEAGFNFSTNSYGVFKNGTNVVITVICSNPNVEPVSVSYATADGTATAGTDYTATSGTLAFTNGVTTNTFTVPINNNNLVEGNTTFSVNLSNPTLPGQLVTPATASITITDINAGLMFSAPTYSVFKSGVAANVTVTRTGYTNNNVAVNYATQDGSGTNGVDYFATSGTLVFTNGQTSQSFSVPVINTTYVKPDRTVLLQLSSPLGTNAVLVAPSAAVLTIKDNSGSLVVAAGAALVSESGPVNGVIDPGETVTLLFGLRNGGGTNTVNLVATLLPTNGVSSPSGAQSYGALVASGPSASRYFTFTASGTNGQPILATFQLTDGAANLGTATFTFALGNGSTSFTNSGLIVINDATASGPSPATPYPAQINVNGVGGSLSKLTVTLNKLTHSYPRDIDALLVSPAGTSVLLMAHAGLGNAVQNAVLTFDDAAATSLPQSGQIVSGTNKPTAYFPVVNLPAPAPSGPYTTTTTLAAFNGSNPNGLWSLYIIDDAQLNSGMVSNGWSLNLTFANTVPAAADLVAGVSAAPNPVVAGNNLIYTVTVTNFGPSAATGVLVTNTLPPGVSFVFASPSQGSVANYGNQIVWNAAGLALNAYATLTITALPSAAGTITDTCSVQANEADPNLADNLASVTTTVINSSADLSVGLADAPNPLWLGANLTYTITVTNGGPATATGVVLTNTLPPSAGTVISATPNAYILLPGNLLVFTNLGSLAVGGQTVATIVVRPSAAGTITNSVRVASLVTDPFKGNNIASVKTVVQALQLGAARSGHNLVITWPSSATGYVLDTTTNLNPPAVWTQVTSPAPTVVNGQNTVTISIGNGRQFFRLRSGP